MTRVNYLNPNRAPLLLIAGAQDHQVPASVNRDNFRKYARSKAVTAFREFSGRSHFIIGQTGWGEVAEFALSWAKAQTAVDAR